MRKQDLVEIVVDRADMSPRHAEAAVSAIFEEITNALSRGENVALVGFGAFSVKRRAARSGRNPQTGDLIAIPESLYPTFKAGKAMKDAVSE